MGEVSVYVMVFLLMAGTALAAIETGQAAGSIVVSSGGASVFAYLAACMPVVLMLVSWPGPRGARASMLRDLLPATGEAAGASGNVSGGWARASKGSRAGLAFGMEAGQRRSEIGLPARWPMRAGI